MSAKRVCALLLILAASGAAVWPGARPSPEIDRVRRLLAAGRNAEARELLLQRTRAAPADALAWSLLGQLFQESSRFAEAADALERAVALDPHDVPSLTALANARIGLGRPEQALEAFTRSVAANRRHIPPLASAHASFAVFLLRLNRVSEAREQLRLASAIAPDDPVTVLAQRALGAHVARPGPTPEHSRPADAPRFVDRAAEAGLDFRLENSPTPRKHQIETMPGGVAVVDFDADGFMDLYFANGAQSPSLVKSGPQHWNRLYRNQGDGTFRDVTSSAGVAGVGYAMAAAAGDYDNDGFTDLFVAGVDRNVLYRNNGDGTFADVTDRAGLGRPHPRFGRMWGIHGAWMDYDNDGGLDLLVVNYCRWDPRTEPVCGDPASGRVAYCHPRRFAPLPNQLFRNRRDGTFTDVSEAAGIARHLGKGMGAAMGDLDGDGWADLFVANDAEPNFLFWNRRGQGFTEIAMDRGAAVNPFGLAVSSMGVDWRDLDEDGRPDLFVTALSNEGFLLLRNAGGHFEDAAHAAGLGLATLPYSGWSNAIADFDNDGWKDLFSANGHALDDVERAQDRAYRQRNAVFQNMRDGTFRDVSAEAGPGLQRVAAHRGAAMADFDNDGRLDLVVTALGERPSLLRNVTGRRSESAAPLELGGLSGPPRPPITESGGHWLLVRLRGRASNRLGLGATVRVETAGRVQWNHATTSVGFASSSDPRVHFGLGDRRSIRRLEVQWPSGRRQVVDDVAADQVLELSEPEG